MNLNFENLNQYLKDHPSKNTCGHSTTNIILEEFIEIGNLYDSSYGHISYLSLQSINKSEEFIGTYPLEACKVMECNKCGQVAFFHLNDGGIAPRGEFFLADYSKDYLSEPAVNSVWLKKIDLDSFIKNFQLEEQLKNANKGFLTHHTISDKDKKYIFNYREIGDREDYILKVNFDLVGSRGFLREVEHFRNTL